MKRKAKRFVRGSISILLVIIMMPMLTMAAIVVDSSRLNLAKSMVSSAGDLTVNTALANYDTILKDVYGLFAMSQTSTDADFQELIRNYFETTLVGYGITDEENAKDYVKYLEGGISDYLNGTAGLDDVSRNFLQMTVEDDFSATKVKDSTLANSEILRTQLVEYMKYRAPLSIGLSFLDSLKAFTTIQDQTNVVQTQVAAQESAQDVTSACKITMDSIREFDKLIDKIESGELAVKGHYTPDDEKIVPLDEYSVQFDAYKTLWGSKDYEHINKLTLIFFTKSPGISDKVLGRLGSTKFINSSNGSYSLVTNNSGVNVNVSLAGDLDSAKSQYNGQLNKVNGLVSTINRYVGAKFLPVDGTLINSDSTVFVNESGAINAYINFEKFLLDQHSDIKHSDIKALLEHLLTYRKYYENYRKFLQQVVEKEKQEMDAAKQDYDNKTTEYNNAVSARDGIVTKTNQYKRNIEEVNIPYINEQTAAFKKLDADLDFLALTSAGNGTTLKSCVEKLLQEIAVPTSTKTVGGKSFKNYSGLKSKIADSDKDKNIYFDTFGKIANAKAVPVDCITLCSQAKEYYNKKLSGSTTKTFTQYVTAGKNTDLYKLFEMLDLCSTKANIILEKIKAYDSELSGYSAAVTKASNALSAKNNAETKYTNEQTDYNNACAAVTNLDAEYASVMRKFVDGVGKYQKDLISYGKYATTAKNVAAKEAKRVKEQFDALESNLKAIIDQLGVIEKNLETTRGYIVTYNTNLNTWSDENQSYASKNGSDSFSDQNAAEIKSSKSQYNVDQLDNLKAYVTSIKTEYNELYSHITNTANYKYGTTRIDTIDTAEKLSSAVSGVKDKLPAVVTVNDAAAQLDTLYPNYNAPKIFNESHQKKFLKDSIIPLQFLIYLNSNYPEAAPASTTTSDGNSGSSEGSSNTTTEASYNDAKDDLKKGTTDNAEPTGFGYTYNDGSKTLPSDRPSNTKDNSANESTFDTQSYKLNEADGKVDASSGLSSQSNVLGKMLGGLGNIATTGLENLYLLSYIFENFSYNTMVQDIIADDKDAVEAKPSNKSQITPGAYKTELVATTLSNFKIDAKNNYLYGGEIEYILFGNSDFNKNVKTAKGAIYAIRFAFNCIYAFTDSEIKTMTMSAGLAVQTATLGVVPYQVVQIVLQLALAAAEAAIDLDYINNGMDVAVIKSRDTWNLSVSGMKNNITDIATKAVDSIARAGINTVSGGIQKVVDAATDKLNDSVNGLATDLTNAVTGKAEDIVNTAFAEVSARIDDALNKVQFIDFAEEKANAKALIDSYFAEAKNIDYASLFPDNEIASTILSMNSIQNTANGIIDSIHAEVIAVYSSVPDPATLISDKINSWKMAAMNSITSVIGNVFDKAKSAVTGYATDISNEIKGYVDQTVTEYTEEAAEQIKEKVSDATNNFMNKYITEGNAVSSSGAGLDATTKNGGTSLANILAFGYKEYLMLFTYISLCANTGPESSVMKRIGDVIQMNIANNKEGEFKHEANKTDDKGTSTGSFLMSKAYTYVQIEATVHLDMLFLDMDFFNRMITDDSSEDGKIDIESDLAGTKIKYSGFLGY